jgi:hypothetical protein
VSPESPEPMASSSTIVHSSREASRSTRSRPGDAPLVLVDEEQVVGPEGAERQPEQAEDADPRTADRQPQRARVDVVLLGQPRQLAEGGQVGQSGQADSAAHMASPSDHGSVRRRRRFPRPARRTRGHGGDQAVDARLAGQLRMERDGDDIALPDRHDALVGQPGQNLYAGSHALDYGGSDEDRVHRAVAHDRHQQVGLERVELAPEGVALDGHVEQREDGLLAAGDLLGDDDHSGAGAEDRRAGPGQRHDRLAQVPAGHELAHRRALAAGQDQAGEPLEVLGQANVTGSTPIARRVWICSMTAP